MIKNFDHVTVCVRDLEAAKNFFSLLGFEEDKRVIIAGEPFAGYMGVADIQADHLTMVVPGLSPRLEVQLLHYRHPQAQADPVIERLDKLGFNHICFASAYSFYGGFSARLTYQSFLMSSVARTLS